MVVRLAVVTSKVQAWSAAACISVRSASASPLSSKSTAAARPLPQRAGRQHLHPFFREEFGDTLGGHDDVFVVRHDDHVRRAHTPHGVGDVLHARVVRLTTADDAGTQAPKDFGYAEARAHRDQRRLRWRDFAGVRARQNLLVLLAHVFDFGRDDCAVAGDEREQLFGFLGVDVALDEALRADD